VLQANRVIDRRAFLADLGHGAVAIALVTMAGCSPSALGSPSPRASSASSAGTGPTPSSGPGGPAGASPPQASSPPASGGSGGVAWERVNLGFVSAYLLVRGGEAALVDTGVGGSEGAIGASLTGIGLGWDALAHLILTHHHNDHQGSAAAVLANAPQAVVYAGTEDVSRIVVAPPVTAVADGATVFDLQIVATPGHTPGSISVLDPVGGVLVVGDAMGTNDGRPTLPGAQFSDDMDVARQSIVKLGGLTFETLLVGHGDPITSGASRLVAELGATG
jgi:glyoxylase-like metal-dependent hydrolase (beta-lactamase superfamily II)